MIAAPRRDIPDGGGHRVHGRSSETPRARGAGLDYLHVAVDDHSRYAYVEALPDERGVSCAAFLQRALTHFRARGVSVRRVLTDNAKAYTAARSFRDAAAAADVRLHHTRPYRPQTNGKAERFIQTLQNEWAYARPYRSNAERLHALPRWLYRYNARRPHGGIGGAVRLSTSLGTTPSDASPRATPTPAAVVAVKSPTPSPYIEYTVKAGDTLTAIVSRFVPDDADYTEFARRIIDINNIESAASLSIGQVLLIPGGQRGPRPPRVTASQIAPVPTQECSTEAAAAKAAESIAVVLTSRGTGTAFYIGDSEWITAEHVVTGETDVRLANASLSVVASVIGTRDDVDLAVLSANTNVAALRWGAPPAIGAETLVMGYGSGHRTLAAGVTRGIVSERYRSEDGWPYIRTDAAANPGNSGGPLMNLCGDVIGVVQSKLVGGGIEGVAYALAADSVRAILPSLRALASIPDDDGVREPEQLPIFYRYEIRQGDTLLSIALHFGIDVDYIIWNNIDILPDADLLRSGQTLQIPSVGGIIHDVRLHETLLEIADTYDADINEIIAFPANNLIDANTVRVGSTILVPGGRVKPPPPQATPTTSSSFGFIWPAAGRMTSWFGPSHPLGIDIAMSVSTPVFASAAGQVTFVGGHPRDWSYGYHVIIKHDQTFTTRYGHLSRFAVTLGEWVEQGDLIGYSGATGDATEPHLHFEIRRNGTPQNPINFLP